MVPNYVKLRYRVGPGRAVTCWAVKLRSGCYRQVNDEGEWGSNGSTTLIVTTPADVVYEKPARESLKYGTLELVEP